jgi:hypothetical protein
MSPWFQKCVDLVDPNGGLLSQTISSCHTDTTAVAMVVAAGVLGVAIILAAVLVVYRPKLR